MFGFYFLNYISFVCLIIKAYDLRNFSLKCEMWKNIAIGHIYRWLLKDYFRLLKYEKYTIATIISKVNSKIINRIIQIYIYN